MKIKNKTMMDFMSLFFTVFMCVLTSYNKIMVWFFPLPKQMLIYEEETKRVMVRGFINWDVKRLAIDHFMVDGNFDIKIDGKSINCIKNRDNDNFRADKQYFLTSNHRVFIKPTKITITKLGNKETLPPVPDVSESWDIKPYTPVDFVAMINDMGDNL